MAEPSARILLVGHCTPDAYALRSALTRLIPGAAVECVSCQDALEQALPRSALLLVNRELDGEFEARDGVALIRALAERTSAPRMMLVSNYPDAQAQAQAAGAVPGFGKRDLYAGQTGRRLLAALGRE